jgi:hypothetical protein
MSAKNCNETQITEKESAVEARRLCSTAVAADDPFTGGAICAGGFLFKGGTSEQSATVSARLYREWCIFILPPSGREQDNYATASEQRYPPDKKLSRETWSTVPRSVTDEFENVRVGGGKCVPKCVRRLATASVRDMHGAISSKETQMRLDERSAAKPASLVGQ